MMGIKDWVFSQLIAKTLALSRPLSGVGSFYGEEPINEGYGHQVAVQADASSASDSRQENQQHNSSSQARLENSCQSHCGAEEKLDWMAMIENLQIKFLRLLCRLGLSQDNIMVTKVLYRLHLATLIRAGESDLKRGNIGNDRLKAIAAEQEVSGRPELDFSVKVLVLGRTGVGKSSTINSIFNQAKAFTDAFQPATNCIQEIVGTVHGIKISCIDTPGLLPSSASSVRKNRKILYFVKRFIRKSPPDIVLFCERLDLISMGYADLPLLKLITQVFGPEIWFNTFLVMTHSSSALPEGPNGYPISYESYINRCTDVVQHYIHQAVSDSKLENPVLLVENHPDCEKDITGEKILPNGQAWKTQFFLLCICAKVLGDVNTLLEFQDGIKLGPLTASRLPSLPHLLSTFLRHCAQVSTSGAENDMDEMSILDMEEQNEYDQLPPIRILSKSQFEKLSNSQKKDYLDELDYRETLYLKKQLKEKLRKRRDLILSQEKSLAETVNSDNPELPEAVLLPDMAVPPSFDSDCPVHRYRCLVTSEQWLARPVLDPHGWDHDVGFDGVNLETATQVNKNVYTSVTGQMSKDKEEFSIQSEFATSFIDPRGPIYTLGLDVQSADKGLIYIVHSNAKLRNLKYNITGFGFSVMSYGNNYYVGTKLEDSFSIGKKLKFVTSAGRMGGVGQAAYGGSFEATLRGNDYPVRNDSISLTMTALSYNKDIVLSGNLQSDFRISQGTRMSVNASLNSQNMGQVCLKTTSSDHMEVALIAAVSIFKALLRRKATDDPSRDSMETR